MRREAELAKREANLASPGAEDALVQAAIQASLAESTPGAADVTAKSVVQAPGQTNNNCIVIDDDDAESDEVPGAKRARTDAFDGPNSTAGAVVLTRPGGRAASSCR